MESYIIATDAVGRVPLLRVEWWDWCQMLQSAVDISPPVLICDAAPA